MGYPILGGRGYLTGFNAITATSLTTTGAVTAGTGVTATTGNIQCTAGQFLAANGAAGAPSYSYVNSPTSGRYRVSADVYDDVSAGVQVARFTAGTLSVNGAVGATQVAFTERTDPSGTANVARLYAADNAAKTELRVIFGTGATQVIEMEP